MEFQILSGNWGKTWTIDISSRSQGHGGIQSWQDVPAKSVEKNTREPL
jgi:hypothetical protein